MEAADNWQRLVNALDEWTAAVYSAPGEIHVSLPDGDNRADAVIVMTPDQWDDMSGVMWGNFDDALKDVKRTLLGLRPHERFAVDCQYRFGTVDRGDVAAAQSQSLPSRVVGSGRRSRRRGDLRADPTRTDTAEEDPSSPSRDDPYAI